MPSRVDRDRLDHGGDVAARVRHGQRDGEDRQKRRRQPADAAARDDDITRARQIAQGAPFDMLMSADERYVFDLQRAGHTRGEGALYAIGRGRVAVRVHLTRAVFLDEGEGHSQEVISNRRH